MNITVQNNFWFADISDTVAYQNAASSMTVLMGSIHGAKPFPASAQKVMDLAARPDFRTDEVVRVVEGDPGFSARLLGVVNSAAFALAVPCRTVSQAVTLLGSGGLREAAATAIVLDFFKDGSELGQKILDHASAVAQLARYLAPRFDLSSEDMFTAGLLHDLGKTMMIQYGDKAYRDLFASKADTVEELHLEERKRYGYDHAVLGGHMFQVWKIPAPFPQVIAWHHQPARAVSAEDKTMGKMVALLRVADALTVPLREGQETGAETATALAATPDGQLLRGLESVIKDRWKTLKRLYDARGDVLSAGAEQDDTPKPISVRPPSNRPPVVLCAVCKEEAGGDSCSRCTRPLCKAHKTTKLRRCTFCERDFRRERAMVRSEDAENIYLVMAILGAVTAAVAFAFQPPGHFVLGPVGGVVAALGAALRTASYRRETVARKKFIGQRMDA